MKKLNTGIHSVYIGNLNYNVTEDQLLGLFKKYGYIKNIKLLKEGKENKSKGIAFVDMVNMKDATNAIKMLNGTEHMGRTLKVNMANTQNFKHSTNKECPEPASQKISSKMIKKHKKYNKKFGLDTLLERK